MQKEKSNVENYEYLLAASVSSAANHIFIRDGTWRFLLRSAAAPAAGTQRSNDVNSSEVSHSSCHSRRRGTFQTKQRSELSLTEG